MPRLSRIRYYNMGHPYARMLDLIIPLHDPDGQPIDSTIWLRNGGGKSSILNLFFSLIQPNRKNFLGGKSDQERQIEDYVDSEAPGAVIAEWQLDMAQQNLFADDQERYLTGVFYEKRPSAAVDAGRLRRLFFAARVIPAESRLTLDGLPLITGENGSRAYRTMSGFKQEWQALGNLYPYAEVRETEHQGEWREILLAVGIDTDLFDYQMHMNRREGGAEDLFRFKETDQFIDFFLALVVDDTYSNSVVKNIEAFRTQLRERAEQRLPEIELAREIVHRLQPLVGAHSRRMQLYHDVALIRAELDGLALHLDARIKDLGVAAAEASDEETRTRQEASRLRGLGAEMSKQASFYRFRAAQEHRDLCFQELQALEAEINLSRQQERIWKVARPLHEALQAEAAAAHLQNTLTSRETEHESLLVELKRHAQRYAAAVNAHIDDLQGQEQQIVERSQAAHDRAAAAREQEVALCEEAATLETRAESLSSQLAGLRQIYEQLQASGTLQPDEDVQHAVARLGRQHIEVTQQLRAAAQTLQLLKQLHAEEIEQQLLLTQDAANVSARVEELRQFIEVELAERQILEQDPQLRRYLELETIDLDRLDERAASQLHQVERRLEAQMLELWMTLEDHSQKITHLLDAGLLPPSHDVRAILTVLHNASLTAWSGWEYVSQNVPEAEMRDFISQHPDLVLGVIVREAHYERAQAVLNRTRLQLNTPVVIASQPAILKELPSQLVVGPTSDAYFSRAAGEHMLSVLQASQTNTTVQSDEQRRELVALRQTLMRLERYRQLYPPGNLAAQQDAAQQATDEYQDYQRRISHLSDNRARLEAKIGVTQAHQATQQAILIGVEAHQARLEMVAAQVKDEPAALHALYHELVAEANQKRSQAARAAERATAEDEQARRAHGDEKRIGNIIHASKQDLVKIRYLDADLLLSEPGDRTALGQAYQQSRDVYEQRLGGGGLVALLQHAIHDAQAKRQKFVDACGDLDEDVVRTSLKTLPTPESIDDEHDSALEMRVKLEAEQSGKKLAYDSASRAYDEREREWLQLGIAVAAMEQRLAPELSSFGLLVTKTESEISTCDTKAAHQEAAAQMASDMWKQLIVDAQMLDKDRKRLATLRLGHADLLSIKRTVPDLVADVVKHSSDEVISGVLDRLEAQLQQAQADRDELDAVRTHVVHLIQKCTDMVSSSIANTQTVRYLRLASDEEYEQRCDELIQQLQLRAEHIEQLLAEIDKQRRGIVQEILIAAKHGLRLLKLLEPRSKLPSTLRGLGDQPFLKIRLNDPGGQDEMRRCIEELLDTIIQTRETPKGIELVQRAVRRLAGPIRVRLLFPDPDVSPRYDPITEMSKRSGGERLTSAILLYCTLAQLRTRERGGAQLGSSTLMLDNPIGTASRPKFLELQREVAQAAHIQLVYTTGVNDFEAIRMLPNIVRIRNDRVDRDTGERIVEIQQESGWLQGVRLILPAPPTEGANHEE